MNTLPTADGLHAARAPRRTKQTMMHSRAIAPRRAGAADCAAAVRAAGRLAALAAALTLAACGGGGGGSGGTTPPPPPPDPIDAVITLGTTTPANGTTDVKVGDALIVVWSVDKGVYDSSSATLACDGTNLPGALDASKTGGTWTPAADLPRGATCSFGGKVNAKGESGGKSATKNWNVTFQTEAPVIVILDSYDVAIGVRYSVVGLITKTAPFWQEADNQTSYQSGAFPLFNCMVSEEPQANGHFLESCWAAADSMPHIVQHNPITNVVTDFVDTVPAGYEITHVSGTKWNFGPKWHAVGWGTAPFNYMLTWAGDPSGGYFWTDFADNRVLRYQSASGVQSVLYDSPDRGSFTVMVRAKHVKK